MGRFARKIRKAKAKNGYVFDEPEAKEVKEEAPVSEAPADEVSEDDSKQ